jgi:hypothetical protein
VEAERATGGEFAATWRNSKGEIVGSTFGGTMCWMPLKPWSLRISREDWTGIVPCGECPGCLEFYRRRLADRLDAKYGVPREGQHRTRVKPEAPGDHRSGSARPILYLIRIYAPIEQHAALSRKLHRRRGLELEPGFIRLGATSFAVLSHARRSPPLTLNGEVLETRTEPILLSRGRRAWRSATAGMLVAREAYGEQRNRWYIRGLPAAEKESWNVLSQAGEKGYSRARDPRVWKHGNLTLVPPEIWSLGRGDRRTLRRDLGAASSPEGVARVMAMVSALVARKSQSSLIGPAGRPVLTREQVLESYAMAARRSKAASGSERPLISPSPPSEGGGYISSVHIGGADPPGERSKPADFAGLEPWTPRHFAALPEDSLSELTQKQYLHRKHRKLLDEQLERISQRLKGGS